AFALAVEAGVPVVPVTVVDAYRLMDESRRVMRPGTVRLVVGTPIPTEGLRRRDLPDLMADVQAQMEAELEAEQAAWNAQRIAVPAGATL
ncbi:MAG: lysophospholipid acyltransferase family protein, partial [Rhodothermales bacterium]